MDIDTNTDTNIDKIISVTELNILIKDELKKSFPNKYYIKGELSGYKKYGNSTIYATLKDDISSINIIKFKANKDEYNNGDMVCITGNIDYYIKNGNINFICTKIENIGEGNIKKKLDNLKNKYEKLGYFNNKHSLPKNIKSIGIITAKDGAALQDILFVLNSNKYIGNIYIKNSPVQGNDCPRGICEGIEYFNNFIHNNKKVDLIMITRGGGSTDDLMGFSHPDVIESIHNSKIFTMSAVGHEIDNMISDYVANIRAPTPSIGAEMICKTYVNKDIILHEYQNKLNSIRNIILCKINNLKKSFFVIKKTIYNTIFNNNNNKIDTLNNHLSQIIITKFKNIKYEIDKIKSNLEIIKNNKYNALLLYDNKQINSVDDIKSGMYKIKINGEIKEIQIKI
jgi:exodeoxyribonuclease VII large subunit